MKFIGKKNTVDDIVSDSQGLDDIDDVEECIVDGVPIKLQSRKLPHRKKKKKKKNFKKISKKVSKNPRKISIREKESTVIDLATV